MAQTQSETQPARLSYQAWRDYKKALKTAALARNNTKIIHNQLDDQGRTEIVSIEALERDEDNYGLVSAWYKIFNHLMMWREPDYSPRELDQRVRDGLPRVQLEDGQGVY